MIIQSALYHPVLAPLIAAILGAIFGSFTGALVARWPEQRSVLIGRSHCEGCGKTLGAFELVPIFSWFIQRGRCRSCGAAIGGDALAIELIAAGIGGIAIIAQPGWPGVAIALFGWMLLPLAWLDARHFWLPDRLSLAFALVGLAIALLGFPPTLTDRLVGGVAGFGLLWLIGYGYRRLRGREGLGGGDPKLLGAIGLWLGWQALPLVLLLASFAGLVSAAVMALRGRAITSDRHFPLGTLMAVAAWVLALLGPINASLAMAL